MFDTLEYAEELKAAGVPEGQAHVQARALSRLSEEKLASKEDIALLKTDITLLKTDIASLRTEMGHIEDRLRAEIGQVKTEMDGKFRLLYWMNGTVVALLLPILFKLFLK
jgi:hypothetical protein